MLLMLLTIMAGEVVWSGRSMFLPGVFSRHCSQSARLGSARHLPRYKYPATYNELGTCTLSLFLRNIVNLLILLLHCYLHIVTITRLLHARHLSLTLSKLSVTKPRFMSYACNAHSCSTPATAAASITVCHLCRCLSYNSPAVRFAQLGIIPLPFTKDCHTNTIVLLPSLFHSPIRHLHSPIRHPHCTYIRTLAPCQDAAAC